jgi:hypothetical protein
LITTVLIRIRPPTDVLPEGLPAEAAAAGVSVLQADNVITDRITTKSPETALQIRASGSDL